MAQTIDYEGAKAVIAKIQNNADSMQAILNRCNQIISETVNVENRWTGTRATNFKKEWDETAEDFNKFDLLIKKYSSVIELAYQQYRSTDQ